MKRVFLLGYLYAVELALDEQPFIMIGVIVAIAGKMIKEPTIHYNGLRST